MTQWLLPDNEQALKAVWPKCRLAEYYDLENMKDGSADEFESDLNMAAFAWLAEHAQHTSLTILLTGGASVTEQLIAEVNMWLEAGGK